MTLKELTQKVFKLYDIIRVPERSDHLVRLGFLGLRAFYEYKRCLKLKVLKMGGAL